MRSLKLSFVLLGLVVFGVVGVASADDSLPVVPDDLNDGRVNYWDAAAPVVVYCTFDHPDTADPDYSVFTGIELLAVNPDTNNGEQVATISAAEIDAMGIDTSADTLLTTGAGFSLWRASEGQFFVTSPADNEGKSYTFVFERGDLNC